TQGVEGVAVYYSAELLVKVGVALVLGIAMAMMTKVTQQKQIGNSAGIAKSFYDAIEYSSALSILIAVGVATVGPQAVYWFLGPSFAKTGDILQVLAFVIVVASWRYSLSLQQMAAERGFRNISASVQVGAGVNVVLTVFLVPKFGVLAAAWAALIGELVALILQVILLSRVVDVWQLVRVSWRYIVAGVIALLGILAVIRSVPGPYPKFSALEAVVGIVIYTIVVYFFSTPVVTTTNTVVMLALKRMYNSLIEFIRVLLRIDK
ncbi:MAG TPA: polysaccharide biosynthesis C-terminal domain-containing protein, partial [Weissella confusa]|nr:polysaccharide biosynthesis C-terminal domain-containing protein [Weissella confusa]